MKPVVILNLIARALSPKSRVAALRETESQAPLGPAGIKKEVGLALTVAAILTALVLALVVSLVWDP